MKDEQSRDETEAAQILTVLFARSLVRSFVQLARSQPAQHHGSEFPGSWVCVWIGEMHYVPAAIMLAGKTDPSPFQRMLGPLFSQNAPD